MRKHIWIPLVIVLALASCTSQGTPGSYSNPYGSTTTTSEPTTLPTAASPTVGEAEAQATVATTPEVVPATESQAQTGSSLFNIIPGESSVTYEVGETFFNDNNRFAVAVGKTTQVNGQIQVDQVNPQNSLITPIEIDVSQLQSDSSRRDGAIRDRFLESSRFPSARFVPTNIEGLPGSYSAGQELTFKVTGDLTVKETTRPVTFDVTARIEGDTLVGTATTTILMSEYGVGPITLAGILGTEDEVKITLTFVARV